jgi:surface protein
MNYLFSAKLSFNEPLEDWDVSNVTSMTGMFDNCMSFNQPLAKWNVSNVKHMTLMFYGCKSFDQDLSGWDVSNVTGSKKMFSGCPIRESYKPDFSKTNKSEEVAAHVVEEESKDLEPGDGEWILGQNQTQGQSSEEPVGGKRYKRKKRRKTRKSILRKKQKSKRQRR